DAPTRLPYTTPVRSAGSKDAVNAIKWTAQARPTDHLEQGDYVTLGFRGTETRDATSLVACRVSDGLLVHLRTWENTTGDPNWSVPRDDVDAAVRDAAAAYKVLSMFCSPQGWQTEVNTWDGFFGKGEVGPVVMEIWLNSDIRVDQILERFLTAHRGGQLIHDGSEILTRHATAAALANGKLRPAGEDRQPGQPDHYQRVVRKSTFDRSSISAFLAALLAYEARGWAIEHGALELDQGPPNLW